MAPQMLWPIDVRIVEPGLLAQRAHASSHADASSCARRAHAALCRERVALIRAAADRSPPRTLHTSARSSSSEMRSGASRRPRSRPALPSCCSQ
ncbi:hypothetical protein U9M48_008027 [Paspalum notatum var. saurae]|uniref:Uncharacterized protein n=1 Tax=Paspalum notatum var. saurae TaxID=547442 RepID=A0AAQ3WCY0_PASNO